MKLILLILVSYVSYGKCQLVQMVGQGLAADAMNLITDFLRNDTKVGHDLGVILDKLTPGDIKWLENLIETVINKFAGTIENGISEVSQMADAVSKKESNEGSSSLAVQHKLLRNTVKDTRQIVSNFKEIVNEAISLVATLTQDIKQLHVVGKKKNKIEMQSNQLEIIRNVVTDLQQMLTPMNGYLTTLQSDIQNIEAGIKTLAPSYRHPKSDFDKAGNIIGQIAKNFDEVSNIVTKLTNKFENLSINSGSTTIDISLQQLADDLAYPLVEICLSFISIAGQTQSLASVMKNIMNHV